MINRFVDDEVAHVPARKTALNVADGNGSMESTIGLEYRSVKRSYHQARGETFSPSLVEMGKVANIWELGNGTLFTDLIRFALTMETIRFVGEDSV